MNFDYDVTFAPSGGPSSLRFTCRIYRCNGFDSAVKIARSKHRCRIPWDWVVIAVDPVPTRGYSAFG